MFHGSPLEVKLRSSILDRERLLTINSDYIEFDNNDSRNAPPTRFLCSDITGFRYGIKPIRGLEFTIGCIYCIDIRGYNDELIQLRLKTIYGIRNTQLYRKYDAIFNALFDNCFDALCLNYIKQFENEEQFEIASVIFTSKGVIFSNNVGLVPWEDLGTKAYYDYYAIFSKQDPRKYKAFEYLYDWNTGILYSVSRQILKNKNLLDT